MPTAIFVTPDAGTDPTGTVTVPAGQSWLDTAWTQINESVNAVPPLVWVAAIAGLTLLTFLTVPFLRTAAFKAGARHGKKTLTDEERRDRRLLIAAMIPAGLFWVAVLIGSGRGLIAFGRDNLRWKGGWEYLVPFTLDGVAIAFALLAFRAVRKDMNPDRSVRIAGCAMLASAGINYLHEAGGSKLGAGYLAILSLLGMLIFDELLAQFEEGTDNVKRTNPKFGLRWLTWPTNTVCAWIAWRNYPTAEGLKATVGNAVVHLDEVRQLKVARRAAVIDKPAWWMRFNPWAHVGALRNALMEQRSGAASERRQFEYVIADLEQRIVTCEQTNTKMAEQFRRETERNNSAAAERLEQERAEHANELAEVRSDHAQEITRLRAELAKKVVPINRSTSGNTRTGKPSGPARSTDAEALGQMFAEHPESGYEWTDREVNRITGAGFSSRAPRLTGMAIRHLAECPEQSHQTCYTERSGSRSDDAEEQSA